jgi:Ni/Co efflux regulator RcnB
MHGNELAPPIRLARKSGSNPEQPEKSMRQVVRITLGAAAAVALSACVVVPAHRVPPPAYRVEYRSAPPPPPARVEVRFHDRQREIAREYYRDEYRHDRRHRRHERDEDRGHGRFRGCPPGLAMRDDRCERAWHRGKRLARDVDVRPVPRDLAVRIGPAPRGYRYAEVAGDILMIAVGTGIVVDAIDNLNQ